MGLKALHVMTEFGVILLLFPNNICVVTWLDVNAGQTPMTAIPVGVGV